MRVDATDYPSATRTILAWSQEGRGRYVCVANVHMTMEAWDDPSFRAVVNGADLVTPDGVPLVWTLRRLGVPDATRVYGPTLMLHVCRAAELTGVPIGLHGGRPEVLDALVERLRQLFPALVVAYAVAPPFTASDAAEREHREAIAASGARILFVALGCPKQERWMARQAPDLDLVQIGVGAAFDFHAGALRQAPAWLQRAGLEWAFRLAMEPRRLAGRYLRHNPRFALHVLRQLRRERSGRASS